MLTKVIHFFAPLGHPLGFVWLVLVIGAVVLFKQHKPKGTAFLAVMAILLTVMGTSHVPKRLLRTLELPYATNLVNTVTNRDAVVLLGGSYRHSKHDTFGFDLKPAADRVITAVELIRLKKANALVVGGSGDLIEGKAQGEAELLKPWFEAWRLPVPGVFTLGISNDTHGEALAVKELMKKQSWTNIFIVTSAYHMKRAEAVFKKLDIKAVGVPCDFQTVRGVDTSDKLKVFPEIENLVQMHYFFHEWIGWYVYKVQGWL